MYNNYNEFIDDSSSEKILLADLRAFDRISGLDFDVEDSLYFKEVKFWVERVKIFNENNNSSLFLTQKNDKTISSNEFYYDFDEGKVYFSEEYNADNIHIIVEYKILLSNVPITLSHDLKNNSPVAYYEPRIITAPQFKNEMATLNSSNSLLGSGKLVLENTDGFFRDIYDSFVFENKTINVYSYNRNLPPESAKMIFRGKVTKKSYTKKGQNVSFDVKDDLFDLKRPLSIQRYDNLSAPDNELFKRVVYGKVNNLLIQSLDKTTGGYTINGTIKGEKDTNFIKGKNTNFLTSLNIEDKIVINEEKYKVRAIKSDTLIITDTIKKSFANSEVVIESESGNTSYNRNFQVTDHQIKEYQTTISALAPIKSKNRFYIANDINIKSGDLIEVNGLFRLVKRVSGDLVVLTTNLPYFPEIGFIVYKKEIFDLKYSDNLNILYNDFEVIQDSEGCKVHISSNAEFNSTPIDILNFTCYTRQGVNKVWSSTPTIGEITIENQENLRNFLMGKYISIPRENDKFISFYFSDNAPLEISQYPEPEDIDGDGIRISLENRNYKIEEIAELLLDAVMISTEEIEGRIHLFSPDDEVVLRFEYNQPNETPINFNTGNNTTPFTRFNIQTGTLAVGNLNFTKYIKNGDYVKNVNQSVNDFIQVLDVQENVIILRDVFAETTESYLSYKSVEMIKNETPVYCSLFGKTKDGTKEGEFIDNFVDVIIDLLEDSGLSEFIDYNSFEEIRDKIYYTPSLKIPQDFNGNPEDIIDIISAINQTVNGSLVVTNDLKISYKLIDPELKDLDVIDDNDVINWDIANDSFDIFQKVIGHYNFRDYDYEKKESGNSIREYTSEFVKAYINNNKETNKNFLLVDKVDIEEANERFLHLNSLSSTEIRISGSLNLAKYSLGELVIIDFKGLFKAKGSFEDSKRVGLINSVSNTGEKVNLSIIDLGSIYTRASIISDDNSLDYNLANDEEKLSNSYITDNNGLIDNLSDTNGTNLIT